MNTVCKSKNIKFQDLNKRFVEGDFDGGRITSDGGGLLLREVESRRKLIKRFAACFTDYRDADMIDHTVEDIIGQRIYALALGYEDLNDHEELRRDALLATLVGKSDPAGNDRKRKRDKGVALAGKSTLNRLELSPEENASDHRYKKIAYNSDEVNSFFVDAFIDAHKSPPKEIILDLDATDDPLHGNQEGRFYHGYYRCYCYLPLYIFCGDHLLLAKLRSSNIDAASGSVDDLERITEHIRKSWRDVQIIIRADSGFCREEIVSWCEANSVDYIIGLAKNSRLKTMIRQQMERAKRKYLRTKKSCRYFRDFRYCTRKSWNRKRRVVGKAEHLEKGANPRFVVTSLPKSEYDARALYEDLYCARGEMENRIKEQQLDLFADRTSAHAMRSNQLRLWLSSVAYMLTSELRRLGVKGTKFARAQCGTIRNKLFKIGALIKLSVRRVRIMFAEGYPYAELFRKVFDNLQTIPALE
jgi:hypothetical protein